MISKFRAPLSFALLFVSLVFTGCKTDLAHSNLYFHKQALVSYHDSGKYHAEVKRVAERAMNFIRNRAASGETNLAVVLDIDETAISTWDRLTKDDFARKHDLFAQWASTNSGVAIAPVMSLFQETKKLGVKVFFITGRRPFLGDATEKCLKDCGYAAHDRLYLRPADDKENTSAIFKAAHRKKITERGFKITANIGDQESDLAGGFAERTFKLPNPFYFTP
jgi:acid phosphatase